MIKIDKKKPLFKSRKSLLFTLLNIFLFIVLIITVAVKFLGTSENQRIPDNHANILLSVPTEQHSISNILSLNSEEVTSVSTKYSLLYKEDNKRQMFVFSVPVREMVNDEYVLFDNKIYENRDKTFKTQNKEFNINFNKNAVNFSYSSRKFAIMLENTSNIEKEENYLNIYGETREAVKYKNAVDNIDLIITPAYNGLLMEFELII